MSNLSMNVISQGSCVLYGLVRSHTPPGGLPVAVIVVSHGISMLCPPLLMGSFPLSMT